MQTYPQSVTFSVNHGASHVDATQLCETLWRYFAKLDAALQLQNGLSAESMNIIQQARKDIQNMQQELEKGNPDPIVKWRKLSNQVFENLIAKLLAKIARILSLQRVTDVQGDLAVVTEFRDHIVNAHKDLKNAMNRLPTEHRNKLFSKRSFHIKLFDKNALDTLFLGDYVGCCLATNGVQFPAMVQRIIDKGMFFVVAIDEDTKEPVALQWCYFAANQAKPEEIYIAINFSEIRAHLGQNQTMRHALLSRLLHYTGQLANQIGTQGVLIQPMSYGLMINDLNFLPIHNLQVKKVGSCFDPTGNNNAADLYYLTSLNAREFQKYDASAITAHLKSTPVPLVAAPTLSVIDVAESSSIPRI